MIFGHPYYRLRRERKGRTDEYFYLSKSNIKYDAHLKSELEHRAHTRLAELEKAGEEVLWIVAMYKSRDSDLVKKIEIKYRSKKKFNQLNKK